MSKKTDDIHPIIAIPILVAVYAWFDVETNQGRDVAKVMEWYTWIRSFDMVTTEAGNNVSAGISTGLSPLAQLAVVVGFIAVGAVVVTVLGIKSKRDMNKTTALGKVTVKRNRGYLPRKFPQDIASIVGEVVETRGGLADDGGPKFWVERSSCVATPLYWRLAIDYAPGADPKNLSGMITNINDRLIRKDLDVDAIIDYRPLSVVISNPKPPTFGLADYWKEISALPQNELLCAGSVNVNKTTMVLTRMRLEETGAGTLIAGKAGSGKTQFALSTLLSLCMANSPKRLALYIADIKKIDTVALAGLPHLAAPIATSADAVADILAGMVAEMTRRSQVSDVDRSWEESAVAIYIDELATLLSLAGKRRGEIIESINNLARTGRALGMIVIAATQRVVEIETEVFSNLGRRCVLRCNKVSDSNHAVGSSETNGHKLPSGAVSIHDAGDNDGEISRGLFVGKTKDGFDQIVAPFLADINKRWAGMEPRRIAVKPVKVEKVEPVEVEECAPVEVAASQTTEIDGLIEKYGADFITEVVRMAQDDGITGTAIGNIYKQLTGKSMDGTTRKHIREIVQRTIEN